MTQSIDSGRWLSLGLLAAVMLLALALRCAASIEAPMSTRSDAGAYLAMASGLADGTGLVDAFGNRAYYSSGYPILLGVVFMVFGTSLHTIFVVNLVLALISVYLIFRIGRLLDCERAGLIAALLWAAYVPSIQTANCILKENLMIPLMLAQIWIVLAWPATSHRILLAAAAGVITGALAVVGPTGCVVAGVLLVMMFVRGSNWFQWLSSGVVFFLFMCVTLAPWLYRNHLVLGAPVLNSNGGFNLYLGNNPAATGRFVSIAVTPMAQEWHSLLRERGEVAASREAGRRARAYMRENPGRTATLWLKKAGLFWELPKLRNPLESESIQKRILRGVWFAQDLFLLAFAAFSLAWVRRAWPLHLSVLLFVAIHVPFYVMTRYRLPIMAVLCVLAAVPLSAYFSRPVAAAVGNRKRSTKSAVIGSSDSLDSAGTAAVLHQS